MEKNKNQNASAKSKKEIDLDKYYHSAGTPSLKSLNFGLWLATNRRLFFKGTVIILVAICLGFFLYSGYHFGLYFLGGQRADGQLFSSTPNGQVLSDRNPTVELALDKLQVFKTGSRYDLTVKIKNPNDKFMARFDYCFSQAGQEFVCYPGFIFPQEEKYLLGLGNELASDNDLSVALKNLSWQRINTHLYPDWANFYQTHTNFLASNIKFNEADSAQGDFNILSFNLENRTPYSFWAVPFSILIFNGGNLVGVNNYTANNFLSQESRSVDLNWSGRLTSGRQIQIVPNLDIVASDIYLKK